MDELMAKFIKVSGVFFDVNEKIVKLEEDEFKSFMCMMFDEYRRVHNDGQTAPEMAKFVSDTVARVNSAYGEYKFIK